MILDRVKAVKAGFIDLENVSRKVIKFNKC